jgi:monoamine oxidase
MQFNTNSMAFFRKSTNNPWIPHYPNPADFRFNYFHLMENAPQGIGKLNKKVAIVGSGSAAISAARELMRSGCDVTIYEASDRIGGRLYTAINPNGDEQTGIELGAMRMPFFADGEDSLSAKEADNSLLGYYLFKESPMHSAKIDVFPNPGNAIGGTGVYVNQGYGPKPDAPFLQPQLISWPKGDDPDNKDIQHLNVKVDKFIQFFTEHISEIYVEDNHKWERLWKKMVDHYGSMTFDDLVMEEAHYNKFENDEDYDYSDGNLGGMGMTQSEASILYTIGTGDGSWGAFYSISALWWIRCTLFGFGGKGLQTVIGMTNSDLLPYYKEIVTDSSGTQIVSPTYKGIQGFVEYLYYGKIATQDGNKKSLYEESSLYVNTPVSIVEKQTNGQIKVVHSKGEDTFDHVLVTSTQWATQMSISFKEFSFKELPLQKTSTEHTQHNISSCKFFFPLKTQYWTKIGNKIPQIIVSDEFIQDSYAFAWEDESKGDKGVILASYTWEDDSLKLLPYTKEELSKLILAKLRDITMETVGEDVTQYIDTTSPIMMQWIKEPSYIGCSKLYRQRDEEPNLLDLTYNQNYSGLSGLYFAGENYSVEGGWTEPAIRSSIDAVIQMINHNDGEFTVKDFSYKNTYPRWSSDIL